ncbi:MAG: hypothetical protein ACK4SF_18415 [Algoriphagus aquaeductus]|uniref:Uncharacterized protein n=1 Tax=Algoriphagus aquaeductus TaxID=475299 RepID=A0A326RZV2_9BACT|nr:MULTISPECIES: hypothetical protein [Algoriphagus]PZV87190.1 hypothetical protein CLV31_10162 [Algoriphagus aquaeductus]
MKFLEKDEIKNPSVTYTELVVVSIASTEHFPDECREARRIRPNDQSRFGWWCN